MLPTIDLQISTSQSTSLKTSLYQSHHQVIYVNNTLSVNNPITIQPQQQQFSLELQKNTSINWAFFLKDVPQNPATYSPVQQGLCLKKPYSYFIFSSFVKYLKQSTPTLNVNTFFTINNPYTICCTKSRVWKADVITPFMSLEANPYISAAAPSCDWTKPLSR